MREKRLPAAEQGDLGMSAFSRRASDRFLRSLQQAEADNGRDFAGEVAEAHVDAGARYLDGERVCDVTEEAREYLASMPTAATVQNLI